MPDKDERGWFTKGNSYAPKKGEVRNPLGRPPGRSIRARLREIIEGESGEAIVDALIGTAIQEARNGDFRFWNAIVENVDGKIPDRIAGYDGGPITFDDEAKERVRKMVEAADLIDDNN